MNYEIGVRCHTCSGTGRVSQTIDMGEVIGEVNNIGVGNKIAAIKHIRTKHTMGLKEAKELVEAVIDFLAEVRRVFPTTNEYE